MNKFAKSFLRKVAAGNHNENTLMVIFKNQFPCENHELFIPFIKNLFEAKRKKVLNQPFYAGRNIRY